MKRGDFVKPIKVDFGGKKKKGASDAKRIIISLVITLVISAVLYYFMLPALNFKAIEMYIWLAFSVIIFIGIYGILAGAYRRPEKMAEAKNKMKIPIIILLVMAVIVGIGYLTGAVFFRAKSYSNIIKVQDGDFAEEVAEIDFSSVPQLDKDASNVLAAKALGKLADYVSQFVVSDIYSTQINYKGTPVRVQSLEYGDIFKWMKNTKNGIPAFIIVDMIGHKAEVQRLQEPMKYSPAEYFNEDLIRHCRFNYPTLMFDTPRFELDDNGRPYWVVPVVDKTIGLFGGKDITGAILVDAATGETTLISTNLEGKTKLKTDKFVTDEEFQWLDRVYSAELLNEQFNYYGKYSNGFINSIIGQTDVKVTSSGYNYLALNDDVYMYTGVTSITSDEGIIGFVLINQRTKDARYYQVSGALENAAQTSAQGKVQQYGYTATFPLLLNVSGEPTYFMSLKDASGYVKMFALVNVKQSTIVAAEASLSDCVEQYALELEKNGISVEIDIENVKDNEQGGNEENAVKYVEVTGKITDIRTATTGGETYFYIKLDDADRYYKVSVKDAEKIILVNNGDSATFEIPENAEGNIVTVKTVK